MKILTRLVLCLTFITAGLWFSTSTAQSQESMQVAISRIDSSHFPEVDVDFRVLDSAGQFVEGLTNFTVAENGQQVSEVAVRLNDALPVTLVYVLDLGQYSGTTSISDALLRNVLSQWAGYFRDGLDTVSIVVSGGGYTTPTTIALAPTQSLNEFRAAVDGLNLTPGQAVQSLTTVQEVLTQLAEFGLQPADTVNVIYISRIVDRLTNNDAVALAATVGAQAAELDAPIYALHTDRDGRYADPFQTLAAASGGQYLPFNTRQDTDSLIATLYGNLAGAGKSYTATYRSISGESAARTVTVGMAQNEAQPASANFQVSLSAPTITITQPEEGFSLLRTATEASMGSENPIFDLDSVVLRFTVNWTDGLPRQLKQVELLANGNVVNTITEVTPLPAEQPTVEASVAPVAAPEAALEDTVLSVTEIYEVTLDLTVFSTEGSYERSLEVRLTDELRLQATSPAVTGSVTVDLPEVLPTIQLVSPANNVTVERIAELDSAGAITGYSLDEIPLVAQLVWSSSTPGEIVSAELLLGGEVVSNIPYPTVIPVESEQHTTVTGEPVPAHSMLELPWDVRAVTAEGPNLHDVQIQVRSAAGLAAISEPITLNVQVSVPELQLPTVAIITPQMNSTVSRTALPRGEVLDFQDSGSQTVIAAVLWPDNQPKTLVVAELLFNGLPLGTESYPTLLTAEEIGAQVSANNAGLRYFRLNWNIGSIQTAGANLGQLQVRIRDVDGFETISSAVPVNVQVNLVSPPTVTVLAPVNNSIIPRTGQLERTSATPSFDTRESAVDAVVEWSPQLPFTLAGADLLVNGTVVGALTPVDIDSANQSLVELPNGGKRLTLRLPWDLSGIQTPGANLYQLQVRVRDDNGITAVSTPVNLNVQVNVPEVLPPLVSITSPANNAALALEDNSLTVTAETIWSDNQVRSIQFIELNVDGVARQTLFYPQGTRFEIVWDAGDVLAEGGHQLNVRVRDVAGLEATSPAVTIQIEAPVALAPTVETQMEAPVVVPEAQPATQPESEIITVVEPALATASPVCPPTLLDGWNDTECLRQRAIAYLPWVAVVVMAGLLLVHTRRMRPGGVARTIVGVGRKRRPIGRLYIMQGPAGKIGQEINLYANITTLGRDPRLTDIQLYSLDDESSISAQHCTIRHVRGRFTLMDDNSTNGTQVNGLYVNEPVLLSDGDEITLGIPDRLGAVLRFHARVVDMKEQELKPEALVPVRATPSIGTNGANGANGEKPAAAASIPVRSTRIPRAKSIDVMDNILSEIAEKTDKPFRPNLTSSEEEKR